MNEPESIFNFFYILLCICIIYPSEVFVTLGLTLDQIFARYLLSEKIEFVRHHQRRTSLNLIVHCALPAWYFLVHKFRFGTEYGIVWTIAQFLSVLIAIFVPTVVAYWAQNNWQQHPISKALKKFSNSNGEYVTVAKDISTEFRRTDVLKIKMNSISSAIATENWIMKTGPYFVYFSHQSDTNLVVDKSETFHMAQDTSDLIQILSINVKSSRPDVDEFKIRINALDFRTLQDRVGRPITIPANVQFHQNIIDRFIEVFKEQVALNPIYRAPEVADKCFACMIAEPNIKLNKQCLDIDADGRPLPEEDCCRNCYCRPMWCVECLARWFASRQNEYEREVWLQQKCSCPLCRSPFCIIDVCYIDNSSS